MASKFEGCHGARSVGMVRADFIVSTRPLSHAFGLPRFIPGYTTLKGDGVHWERKIE